MEHTESGEENLALQLAARGAQVTHTAALFVLVVRVEFPRFMQMSICTKTSICDDIFIITCS